MRSEPPCPSVALSLLLLLPPVPGLAQEPTASPPPAAPDRTAGQAPGENRQESRPAPRGQRVGETVVTALRAERPELDSPLATETVSAEDVAERGYRSTPQVLRDIPGVMVQETAPGQGSPFIRGFTGYRTLFLIDGIRLNNSVFREGPNQYWSTVDPLSIERFEVVKGPGSVLYGSDAIGGTVNALPREVPWEPGWTGGLYYRGATAEESHAGRVETGWSDGRSIGVLLGLGARTLGEIQGGRDVGSQANTGYDERSGDLRVEHLTGEGLRVVLGWQGVRQDDVPRTHSTRFAESFEGTEVGTDRRRDLDQERDLAYVRVEGDGRDGLFESFRVGLSWHDQEEEQDRIRDSGSREVSGFEVGTLGFGAQASTTTAIGRLTYGLDAYRDNVDSFSSTNAVQGPVADDARYDTLGLFVQDEIAVDERLDLVLGARFEYAEADADSVLDPVGAGVIEVEDDWSTVVGSARFVYALAVDSVALFGGVSQGFRAPNLSDLTRFDSARSNEFEIPAPDLDAEHYVSYELGVRSRGDDLSTQAAVFYTDIEDQIVRIPTGNTNGAGEFEVSKDNVGDGWVAGIELGAAYRFAPSWTVFGNATWMDGEVDTFPTSSPVKEREPLDRVMPVTGQLGVRWEEPGSETWVELVALHAEDADDLSTRDESDLQRIPPGGTPGYTVLHARGGWRASESTTVFAALENLFDEDYRVHGSGSNMPGLNLVVGLRVSL